jgi:hypothetical protein
MHFGGLEIRFLVGRETLNSTVRVFSESVFGILTA